MANVSFGINAVDGTRAAFLSVGQGLKRLDDGAKNVKRSFGMIGGALLAGLGIGVSQGVDLLLKKGKDLYTGLDDEDRDWLEQIKTNRAEIADIEEKRMLDAMSDQDRLNHYVKQEADIRQEMKRGYEGASVGVVHKMTEAELRLNRTLQEQDQLRRKLAPDTETLSAQMKDAQKAAGLAIGSISGPSLSASEAVEALQFRLGKLQGELVSLDEASPDGMKERTRVFKDMAETALVLRERLDEAKAPARELGAMMAMSFEDAAWSGGKLRDVVNGLIADIGRMLFRQMITAPIAKSLGSLFGGFFAEGGVPPAGKISIVGENGPEAIVGDGKSRVIPNHQLGGSGGSPIVFHQTNTFADGVQRSELAPLMSSLKQQTIAELQNLVSRRKVSLG